jgi:hypothetical protein
VFGLGLLGAGGMFLVERNHRPTYSSSDRSIGGPYGNGPYREVPCEPNRRVADGLAEIAAKLCSLADSGKVQMDKAALDKLREEAHAASLAGDFVTSIRRYAELIRMSMANIRNQRSTIDGEGLFPRDEAGPAA